MRKRIDWEAVAYVAMAIFAAAFAIPMIGISLLVGWGAFIDAIRLVGN